MTMTKTCTNPKCACESCTCANCKCGAARLGDLERRVIDVLWEDPGRELTGRDVADVVPEYAYTTVATVLDRLVRKGLVSRRTDRRKIRFSTTGTRAVHAAQLMHDALVEARDPVATITEFAEMMSASEADVLRRALGRRSRKPA
ncbi:MAG TPA: BlaI/MecI/CopY family transcriptional regulator [Acidimicrobiales bacterium]|nr:BlaI/MecI/CopY family transcriptional regulator [Acidimicrobiales bacterium]